MKKNLLLLFSACALFLNCSIVDELTKFDLDYQTTYTIQSSTLIDTPFNSPTPDITTETESSYENNNTNKDLIESIKLKKITLTIDTPEDGNFNFLKDIQVYITADGVDEREIASAFDLENSNLNILELEVTDQELKAFFEKDSYKLRVKTTIDETVSATHHITIDTTFRVDAEILGV